MTLLRKTLLVSILVVPVSLSAQATKQQPAPDNTKVNQQDRDGAQPTADQQKGNRADLDITTQIRKLVTEDKNLSTYAKNVKIVTQNGNVTLRGPVRSEEEKKSVEAKANQVAGPTHVKNEIEVDAKATSK